jgi:magnesium chelatase subunit D
MCRALVLNAVNPRIGGVLIRGERGTAKSTAARALAELLPEVRVISGCRFGCHPERPNTWCTECRERFPGDQEVPVETRRTPFIDLPVSATEDRVVGTLDIERAIKEGERHFEPGVLAAANRGLLYIDEVNLLDDHVVDVLLDSAALGMNIVEREGISFSHPARYILVGTMNPEEGDLRPQLLDRFALSVEIRGLINPEERVRIMERNLAFEEDPAAFRGAWHEEEAALSGQITRAKDLVGSVTYSRRDLLSIAALTSSFKVDGHRADLVILKAARAHAAFEGRTQITQRDIALAAELALPHRLRRGPFQQVDVEIDEIQAQIDQVQSQIGVGEERPTEPGEEGVESKKKEALETELNPEREEAPPDRGPVEPSKQPADQNLEAHWWEGGQQVEIGEGFKPRPLSPQLDRVSRRRSGRRTKSRSARKRGRYVMSRPAQGQTDDVAFDATLRAAAPFQKRRTAKRDQVAFAVESSDLQRKVRIHKSANLILFVVDASWSMAVAERMSATKGAILSLLRDAYQRRDRVGLVVFQKDRALTVLPPTNSIELAQRALADIPVGGKTPLSAGLQLAYEIIERDRLAHPDVVPLLILLTDGAGNVSMSGKPPQEEAHEVARKICEAEIHAVVINMEHAAFDQGLASALAERMDAPCHTLHQLKAEHLYRAVRREIKATEK